MSAGDDVDEDRFLPNEKVVDNVRSYLDCLEAEIEVHENLVEALEEGDVQVSEMVEALPSPMPMEAYQRDEWDDYDEDLELSLQEEDGADE